MTKRFLTGAAAAALIAASVTGCNRGGGASGSEGGTPSGPPAENVFPVQTGNTWSYKGQVGTQPIEMDAAVASSTGTGDKKTVVMRWTMQGKTVQEETYIVDNAGVSRTSSGMGGANKIDPPIPVIRYPMSVGKSWTWKGTFSGGGASGTSGNGEATLKVASKDTIQTAKGSVEAYRVDMDLSVSSQGQSLKMPNSYWFAPKVGLVKQQMTLNVPGGRSVDISATADTYTVKE